MNDKAIQLVAIEKVHKKGSPYPSSDFVSKQVFFDGMVSKKNPASDDTFYSNNEIIEMMENYYCNNPAATEIKYFILVPEGSQKTNVM